MTNVLELFDWLDEGRTCQPITDEDRRLFIGYSARPLPGGGIGFIATHDRNRCWSDYAATAPSELIAKLDALGIQRRHWQFIGEQEKYGLPAPARTEFEFLLAEIAPKDAGQ